MVRPPKGYEEDNEAIEYLKLKSFIVQKSIETSEFVSTDFKKKLINTFFKEISFNYVINKQDLLSVKGDKLTFVTQSIDRTSFVPTGNDIRDFLYKTILEKYKPVNATLS